MNKSILKRIGYRLRVLKIHKIKKHEKIKNYEASKLL
jgi:hypothetical protein